MLSFSSLSPRAVKNRLGNRRRTSSVSSELSLSGYSVPHPNCNILRFEDDAPHHSIQRRPSGLSLYGLHPASSNSSDIADEKMDKDGLSVLEPRPKIAHCVGLFELIED